MPTFTAQFHDVFSCACPPAAALATFADTQVIAANHGDLDHAEQLGDGRVAYVLTPQNHGVTTFQGRYTCHYTARDGQRLVWSTEPGGNMTSAGTATFTATPTGCRIDYRATLTVDMDVGRLVAAVVRPVFGKMAQRGQRAYVERMISAAEGGNPGR